jgi:hypothetical protein
VRYEGAVLAGWLRLANGPAPQPAILFYNGFDSTKEMHYLMFAEIAARRGIATLFVDQEGTGEAIRYHTLPKRHDTEVSAGLFFDALAANPAIDKKRIGIVGLSMGGIAHHARLRLISASNVSDASEVFTSSIRTGGAFSAADPLRESRMVYPRAASTPCALPAPRRSTQRSPP